MVNFNPALYRPREGQAPPATAKPSEYVWRPTQSEIDERTWFEHSVADPYARGSRGLANSVDLLLNGVGMQSNAQTANNRAKRNLESAQHGMNSQDIDAMNRVAEAAEKQGVLAAIGTAFMNPQLIPQVTVESLAQYAPAIAGGVIGSAGGPVGTMAGIFAGATATEAPSRAGDILDADPRGFAAALEDPATRGAAWAQGAREGAIVGAGEAASFGILGRLAPIINKLATPVVKSRAVRAALTVPAELAGQMGIAATTEGLAQASSGRYDPFAIALEAVGEIGPAGAEAGVKFGVPAAQRAVQQYLASQQARAAQPPPAGAGPMGGEPVVPAAAAGGIGPVPPAAAPTPVYPETPPPLSVLGVEDEDETGLDWDAALQPQPTVGPQPPVPPVAPVVGPTVQPVAPGVAAAPVTAGAAAPYGPPEMQGPPARPVPYGPPEQQGPPAPPQGPEPLGPVQEPVKPQQVPPLVVPPEPTPAPQQYAPMHEVLRDQGEAIDARARELAATKTEKELIKQSGRLLGESEKRLGRDYQASEEAAHRAGGFEYAATQRAMQLQRDEAERQRAAVNAEPDEAKPEPTPEEFEAGVVAAYNAEREVDRLYDEGKPEEARAAEDKIGEALQPYAERYGEDVANRMADAADERAFGEVQAEEQTRKAAKKQAKAKQAEPEPEPLHVAFVAADHLSKKDQRLIEALEKNDPDASEVIAEMENNARRIAFDIGKKGYDASTLFKPGGDEVFGGTPTIPEDHPAYRNVWDLLSQLAQMQVLLDAQRKGGADYAEALEEARDNLENFEGMGYSIDTMEEGDFDANAPTPEMPAAEVFPPPKGGTKAIDAKGLPVISQQAADKEVASWKRIAKAVGKTGANKNKLIISLFDYTGTWSQPWRDAGYQVVTYDIKTGSDVLIDAWVYDRIREAHQSGLEVVGVLAATPCTTFAGSGARWWATTHDMESEEFLIATFGAQAVYSGAKSALEYNKMLVDATRSLIAVANPTRFHVMENPIGRIQSVNELPDPTIRFQPHNFGDAYTKRTQLFGVMDTALPTANVAPAEGSKMQQKMGSKNKIERSITPTGFAYSFFIANDPTAKEMDAEAAGAAIAPAPAPEPVSAAPSKAAAPTPAQAPAPAEADLATLKARMTELREAMERSDAELKEAETAFRAMSPVTPLETLRNRVGAQDQRRMRYEQAQTENTTLRKEFFAAVDAYDKAHKADDAAKEKAARVAAGKVPTVTVTPPDTYAAARKAGWKLEKRGQTSRTNNRSVRFDVTPPGGAAVPFTVDHPKSEQPTLGELQDRVWAKVKQRTFAVAGEGGTVITERPEPWGRTIENKKGVKFGDKIEAKKLRGPERGTVVGVFKQQTGVVTVMFWPDGTPDGTYRFANIGDVTITEAAPAGTTAPEVKRFAGERLPGNIGGGGGGSVTARATGAAKSEHTQKVERYSVGDRVRWRGSQEGEGKDAKYKTHSGVILEDDEVTAGNALVLVKRDDGAILHMWPSQFDFEKRGKVTTTTLKMLLPDEKRARKKSRGSVHHYQALGNPIGARSEPLTWNDLGRYPITREAEDLFNAIDKTKTTHEAYALADAWVDAQGNSKSIEYIVTFNHQGTMVGLGHGTRSRIEVGNAIERALQVGEVAYLTHNHPNDSGLSGPDVRLVLMRGTEVAAVGPTHRTSALPGPRAVGVVKSKELGEFLTHIDDLSIEMVEVAEFPHEHASHFNNHVLHRLGLIELDTTFADDHITALADELLTDPDNATGYYDDLNDYARRAGLELPDRGNLRPAPGTTGTPRARAAERPGASGDGVSGRGAEAEAGEDGEDGGGEGGDNLAALRPRKPPPKKAAKPGEAFDLYSTVPKDRRPTGTTPEERAAFQAGPPKSEQVWVDMGWDLERAHALPVARQAELLRNYVKEQFGFRAVTNARGGQTPNTLETVDQLKDMYRALSAFTERIGIARSSFGLQGRLSLKLARKGNTAVAGLYTIESRTITIPGRANTLAHEWIHGIDHHLIDWMEKKPGAKANLLSNLTKTSGIDPTQHSAAAFVALLYEILHTEANVRAAIDMLGLEVTAQQVNEKTGAPTSAAKKAQARLQSIARGNPRIKELELSLYAKSAAELDAARGNGQGKYFSTMHELLARSGESYIGYLTRELGGGGLAMADTVYEHGPSEMLAAMFPKAEERQRQFDRWRDLFYTLNREGLWGRDPVTPHHADLVYDELKLQKQQIGAASKPMVTAIKEAIGNDARGVLNLATNPKQAFTEYLDRLGVNTDVNGRQVRKALGTLWRGTHWLLGTALDFMSVIGRSAGQKAPAIYAAMSMLGTKPVQKFFQQTPFHREQKIIVNEFMNRLEAIFRAHSHQSGRLAKKDKAWLWEAMWNDKYDFASLDKRQTELLAAMRDWFNDLARAQKDSGLEFGFVDEGYLPRFPNMGKVSDDSRGFIQKATLAYLEAFDENFADITPKQALELADKVSRKLGLGTDYLSDERDAVEEAMADADGDVEGAVNDLMRALRRDWAVASATDWADALLRGDAFADFGGGLGVSHLKRRQLPHGVERHLKEYLVTDVEELAINYAQAAGRAVAMIKTLGKPIGGNTSFRVLLSRPDVQEAVRARRTFYDPTTIQGRVHIVQFLADKKRDNVFGMLVKLAGRDPANPEAGGIDKEAAEKMLMAFETITGISPSGKYRQGVGNIFVRVVLGYGALRMMNQIALASLSEPTAILLKTGQTGAAFKAWLNYLSAWRRGHPHVRQRAELAAAVMLHASKLYDPALHARLGRDLVAPLRFDRLMQTFFNSTLIQQLTNAQREIAMENGFQWMQRLAAEAEVSNQGDIAREKMEADFREMHVPADMMDRMMRWFVGFEGKPLPELADLGSEEGQLFIRMAHHYVDQVIQDPTRADKMLWANSDYGKVFWQFGAFQMSFWHRGPLAALKRSYRDIQLARDKGLTGAALAKVVTQALSGYVIAGLGSVLVGAVIARAMREFLFNDDEWEKHEKAGDLAPWIIGLGFSSSGIPGPWGDKALNAWTGIKYQTDPVGLLAGATGSNIMQDLQAWLTYMNPEANSENTNNAERNRDKRTYRALIAPASAALIAGTDVYGPLAVAKTLALWLVPRLDHVAADLISGPLED